MILEEIFNKIWSRISKTWCGNNAPDFGNGAQEIRQLNDGEEPNNRDEHHRVGNVERDEYNGEGEGERIILTLDLVKTSLVLNLKTFGLAFGVACISACLLYLDFEATDKCFSLIQYHSTIPPEVHRWELLGETVQATLVNLWFVITMKLLLGKWLQRELMYKLICVGLGFSLIQIVVKAYLIVFNVHNTSPNEVALVGIFYSSYLVGKGTAGETRTTKLKLKIAAGIGAQFLLMLVIALCHRFLVIPLFNEEKSPTTRFAIAMIPLILAFLATSISQYLVLTSPTSWLDEKNRMYALVYFNQLLPLALFRVMQADFENWGFFVGLSIIYSFINAVSELTRKRRKEFWRARLGEARPLLFDRPESEILHINLLIQHFLYHYVMIILSQVYITMYRYSTFDVSLGNEISRMLGRMAVGLVIEFVFNLPQIHFRPCNMRIVWSAYFYRHTIAHVIIVLITICYFSQVLFGVLQVPIDESALVGYRVRNCSFPFTYE